MIAETTLVYSKVVERYAHFFDRPELRLRFLNNTLAQQSESSRKLDESLGRFQLIKGTKLYEHLHELQLYALIFQELKKLLPSAAKERRQLLRRNKAPFTARLLFRCYQMRHAIGVACVVFVAIGLFGLYSVVSRSTRSYAQGRQTVQRSSGEEQNVAFKETSEKYLPDYSPEKVWLVEQKGNYERYSNGGRILLDYETDNHARGYNVLRRGNTQATLRTGHEIVGIVYHTSESDMLPFTPDNSDSIETRTRGLLEYVRKNKSYNYLIDRYGQIYRIVRDTDAANHAGNSIWADAEGVYVGLNESFLGVCFETNSEADSLGEQLTEAQLISGRLLTQILRSRYQIDDANCVTHGLVSVNPSNMLICFHHDWVRNFPFETMGLSDKYKVAPASISEFGFTHDEAIVEKLGGSLWPGAEAAIEHFKNRAEQARMKPEDLRRQLRSRYREQMSLQLRLRSSSASERAQSAASSESESASADTASQQDKSED
ncbi:MAG TPA: peptidoglycan recognition family protein [Pyrinomonadaceae bacterium]|jgi:hypothetical protein